VFPGLGWPAGSAGIWAAVQAYQSLSIATGSALEIPWRWLALDAPGLLLLLPFALLAARAGRGARSGIAVPALAAGVALALQPSARYLLPPAWALIAELSPVAVGTGGRVILAGAALAACLPHLFVFPAAGLAADDRARFGNPWPYLAGRQSEDGFLADRLTVVAGLREAVRRTVPPGGRVLLHDDVRGYRLGRSSLRGFEDADEPVLRRWVSASRSPGDLAKRFRQSRIAALSAAPARRFRWTAEDHPFPWDARMLGVYREFARRRLSLAWRSPDEDAINGDALLLVVSPRDRAGPGGPWPLLPGTDAAWARSAWRMQAAAREAGGRPAKNAVVERDLRALRSVLPGVGEAALRPAHYHLATGDRPEAARWYRLAEAEGAVTCQSLARLAAALPDGPDRDHAIRRGAARCGDDFARWLADEARWREPAAGTMSR
jgi:hypothetical protein